MQAIYQVFLVYVYMWIIKVNPKEKKLLCNQLLKRV